MTQAANAADSKISPPGPVPDAPAITPAPQTNNVSKELLSGFAAAICSTAINSSNFWLGVLCGLAVITGMQLSGKN